MLLRNYFNWLNFYKNGELSRNQIAGRSGVQVKRENEKFTVVLSRSPQNLKCGHFTLLFCRGRQRNVPKCKTHVQSDCFSSLNLLFCGVVVPVAVVVLGDNSLKWPQISKRNKQAIGNTLRSKVCHFLSRTLKYLYLLNTIVNIPIQTIVCAMTAITQDDHRSQLELGPPEVNSTIVN